MHQLKDAIFEGHVYLDHHHPPILWNIVRGGFSSVDALPEDEKTFVISASLASMLQNSSANRLEAELSLEIVRQTVAPSSVSRLTGLFVFDEIESVAQIWESNCWGAHFQNEYLADVGVCARNSSRLDANWISKIIARDGSLLPDWKTAAQNYWLGIPHPDLHPIWERIVDGTFTVWSMHSKDAAFKEVQAIWPNSLGLLTHSMNCFGAESLDGQCYPVVTINEGMIKVEYYLRMIDSLNQGFSERLQRLQEENPKFFAGTPNPDQMYTPNLNGYAVEISLEDKALSDRLITLLGLIRSGYSSLH